MASVSPVPQISIFLAPPEDPIVEPYSPFSATGPTTPESPDAFRPTLLSPPPFISPFSFIASSTGSSYGDIIFCR